MPPFLPRKRLRSPSPPQHPSAAASSTISGGKGNVRSSQISHKRTLFEDLDAGVSPKKLLDGKALLEKLAGEEDSSSLSSASSDEFEDVPAPRHASRSGSDDDVEFEDVRTQKSSRPTAPYPSGDLELTLTKDSRINLINTTGSKKGPSKIERQIRIATHQMHVQMLLWHNALR